MENDRTTISVEQQFREIVDIILQHKSRASKAVNKELLLTAWHVGGYVSAKLKSEEWGSGRLCFSQTEKRRMGKQGRNATVRIYPFAAT